MAHLSDWHTLSHMPDKGTEVLMRKEGDRLILTPIRKNRLLDLLASWEPLDEGLPDVEDPPTQDMDTL